MTDGALANTTQRLKGSLGKEEQPRGNSTRPLRKWIIHHRKSSRSGGNKDARDRTLLTLWVEVHFTSSRELIHRD